MEKEIFELIKKKKFDKVKKILNKEKNLYLNIKDDNNNYLLNYLVNFNEYKIIELILKNHNIRLDIKDIDGRNILYNPIKFNNLKLFKILIEKDNKNIGLFLYNKQDIFGNTPLHYCCILNNIEILKILIIKKSDKFILNNDKKNIYDICVDYNREEILLFLFKNTINFNYKNFKNQNFLQIVLNNNYNKLIDFLLSKNIEINNQDIDGFTSLHLATTFKNLNLIKKLIDNDADINIQENIGNNIYHIALIERNIKIIEYFNELNFNYNSTNIDGDTILHMFISFDYISFNNSNYKNSINYKILLNQIKKTNLNIQNNKGDSCLILLIKNYLLDDTIIEILKEKKLNIFLKNNLGESTYSLFLNKNKILDIVSESFYFLLQKNKDKILLNWEKKCSDQNYKNIKNTENKKKCIEKIKKIILKDKKCFPEFMLNKVSIDNGIAVNNCSYVGASIDILFGLIWLKEKFNYITLCLEYPLTDYESNDDDFTDFNNIDIIWKDNNLSFPSKFDSFIKYLKKDTKFIILPIGITTQKGSHANILFWDFKKNTIERFEPHGSYHPINLNYNKNKLDNDLETKFKKINNKIKYIRPDDYLPKIGFQSIESSETEICKKIGDPNGFCAVWCVWWIYYRILYSDIEISKLVLDLINMIKLKNIKFKTIIRNFSKNITEIRDNYLNKYNIDINDWILRNFDYNIIKKIEKDIYQLI